MKNNILFFKRIFFFTLSLYALNRLVFLFPTLKQAEEKFQFTITFLFLLFFVFSILILFIVKKVSEKSFDNTGMVFMMATFVKTGMVYFIIKPILNLPNNQIERTNCLIVFMSFLIIETIITIGILNKKQ
ncbi:hypothetical protein [Flavobacterium sp.]|jgi:hypothetical protein|uniref:hypothetical protein n=1 Tax=Flavobacterium sp. TaxID=239 RepID=UPI0033418EC1